MLEARSALLTLALALAAAGAQASGGTTEAWLGGTQGWDTTPRDEQDIQILAAGGDGAPALGVGVKDGLRDPLQLEGVWMKPLQGGSDRADVRLQWRSCTHPDVWPAVAVYAHAPYDGEAWAWRGGLIAQVEPWDGCLTLNAEAGTGGPWQLLGGVWTPYVTTMLRLGGDAEFSDGALRAWTPQVLLNGPGDISLALGLRFDPVSGASPRWSARLSYEWFPNP